MSLRERGERALDEVASEGEDAGVDVETRFAEGRPQTRIVDRADETNADLVVMGQQGHTGLGERLLGSALTRVLRNTDVPVLAVPAGLRDGAPEFGDVLVPTDGSDASRRAAPYGADVARRYGVTLHLLSVLDVQREAGIFDVGGVSEAYVDRLLEQARENVDDLSDAAGDLDDLDVVRDVVRGRAHTGVREYVEAEDVGLVVIASRGETSFTGQALGSVTDRVLRVLAVPVLVVPVA
ncbi:universal stress protein [Haloplanus sp. GCM10025708]|uniref:universal stress protein n=1 Tax=Haloplanus sp. GCM10025708 TaxID=3252679 RepID=UPI003607636D